jgi:hypothetical protein
MDFGKGEHENPLCGGVAGAFAFLSKVLYPAGVG